MGTQAKPEPVYTTKDGHVVKVGDNVWNDRVVRCYVERDSYGVYAAPVDSGRHLRIDYTYATEKAAAFAFYMWCQNETRQAREREEIALKRWNELPS